MKSIYGYLAGGLALTFGLAACIPSPEPTSASTTVTNEAPASEPTRPVFEIPGPPPTPTIPQNWLDQPQTPGDWEYARERSETFAIFAATRAAARNNPLAIIRCDLDARKVAIGLFTEAATPKIQMLVEAEMSDRALITEIRDSAYPLYAAELRANDPLLDAIALTRGRFAIAVSGKPALYLPAWAEVTRVIEDCR